MDSNPCLQIYKGTTGLQYMMLKLNLLNPKINETFLFCKAEINVKSVLNKIMQKFLNVSLITNRYCI